MTAQNIKLAIQELYQRYQHLKRSKAKLLEEIEQRELPELIYNSNAIENSSLTIEETKQIIRGQKIERLGI